MQLKKRLQIKIPEMRDRVSRLLRVAYDTKVSEVTIGQVFGGMRGVKGLVSDISSVHPIEGIRLRGLTIPEILDTLPVSNGSEIPLVGGLYFLLLTGDIPTLDEALEIEQEWNKRSQIPDYLIDLLKSMPKDTAPMTLFSQAILSLQAESQFMKMYLEGMRKEDYWEPMLEDSLNLTAKLPSIAAIIYSLKHNHGEIVKPHSELDWGANFARMMKVKDIKYEEFSRLYFIIHSDHELGNVSAHATHLVGSSLSDIYLSASAGMNGLSGPLHGRANQESLRWLLEIYDKFGKLPSKQEVIDHTWETLNSGQVIPGYGHAVLRKTDPRFLALLQFGKKHIKGDEIFDLARLVYKVVPEVLKDQGKAKNPWPNVDAISGSLQMHYGVDDCDRFGVCGFYTVLFGVSRILGVSSNLVWARAIGQPIERPKSLTTSALEELAC
ncbi:MAG: citrate (Si)-synthase [Anaerolineales bacterium]|jgi:citrate synthase